MAKTNVGANSDHDDRLNGTKTPPAVDTRFRSILPHEPLPTEPLGYIHMQGAFSPKRPKGDEHAANDVSRFWTKASLEAELCSALSRLNGHDRPGSVNLPFPVLQVHVLDASPPFTKARLVFPSTRAAYHVMIAMRRTRLCPSKLFAGSAHCLGQSFGSRALQLTQVTTTKLPNGDINWDKSNPPKFRRLLPRPGEGIESINQERQNTRFVFLSKLLDLAQPVHDYWSDPHCVVEAIRSVVNKFDSSGLGAEVFVSHKKILQYCHIGMRSPTDAQTLLRELQEQQVEWLWTDHAGNLIRTLSGRLFVDYAALTHRSVARARARAAGMAPERGEPTRSECTSTTEHVHVPGLHLIPDYISSAEEETLMAVLNGPHAPWAESQSTPTDGRVVKRQVQHYGYVFDYRTADVLRDRERAGTGCPPLPAAAQMDDGAVQKIGGGNDWDVLAKVIERTRRYEFPGKISYPHINQLTVNKYAPGEGIGSHVDTLSAFGDGLLSISLNSGIVMEYKHVETSGDDVRKLVYLPPRSLLLMSGDARYRWEHMIVTRMTDTVTGEVVRRGTRLSLTLRTALDTTGVPLPLVQSSRYPPVWGPTVGQSPLATPPCERDHVHAVYDAIATQWHHTRGKRGVLWPGATQFLQRLPRGSLVADVGCGDGKYFPAIWEAGSYVIGTDISLPLLKTAFAVEDEEDAVTENRRVSSHRRHLRNRPGLAGADCMNLPLRKNSCDAAICIAVLHHISNESRRRRCIEELVRIVKPGGTINVQAWAMEQQEGSRHRFAAHDVFVPFNAQPKYLALTDRGGCSTSIAGSRVGSLAQAYSESFNAEFDDRKGLVVFKRYCHLYKKGELESICAEVDGVVLKESGFESGNHFVVLEVRE